MSYSAKIDQSINSIHLAGIATKILQHMDRVRNVSDLSQARRWGMELLQNARDVSYEDQPVKVRIRLDEDKLTFAHNGKPFRVKDILAIVNQVSSKSGDSKKVGKFGTGFVTTFQLSEEVEIKSVLQDGELPHKPFHIVLDRSGQSNEEILEAIGNAMEELKKVDNEKAMEEFFRDAYNTEFIYHLKTEESKKAARVGMEDLEYNIFYILLFSGKIQEIQLEFNLNERQEIIRFICTGNQKLENSQLSRMDFEMRKKKSSEEWETFQPTSVIYLTQGKITLAVGWKEVEGFVEISQYTPRLFVDFPLIGAEQFPFPVVVGCRDFKTNEPRSGITLVDNASSRDALVNKEIIGQAVVIYEKYLREAVALECKGLEHILTIPKWQDNKEMSEQWVRKHIYKALYNKIASLLMFQTKNQKHVLLNHPTMYLIQEENEAYRAEIRELLKPFENIYVPYGDTDWYRVLQNYPLSEEKIWSLDKILEGAEKYAQKVDSQDSVMWLQKLYCLGLKKETSNVKIRTGQVRIFPNQKYEKEGTLYTINELKKDPGIPEVLKDVCEKLDVLNASNTLDMPLNIRKELLHLDFNSENVPEIGSYEKTKVESYIISRSSQKFAVRNYDQYADTYKKAREEAWMLLLSCGPDEKLYQLCKPKYKNKLPEYHRCNEGWNSNLWRPAYICILNQLTEKMKNCKSVLNLRELDMSKEDIDSALDEILAYLNGEDYKKEKLDDSSKRILNKKEENEIFDWLNDVIAKGVEYLPLQELRCKAIFPNQKGILKPEQWMKKDMTPDEVLKEIAFCFAAESPECD